MGVDELNESSFLLAEEAPDLVEVFIAGVSGEGEPIYALKIGNYDRSILAYGFPHPDEPVGALTLDFLSWALVRHRELLEELGFTWILIKAADVDGARLNEGWFRGRWTPLKYALNRYRPPGHRQVDWTFPVEYKELKWRNPTPGTRALMKVIDEYKPEIIYSLHNSSFTGVYYYISKPLPRRLYKLLQEIPSKMGLPLHPEPETPNVEIFAKGIFKSISIEDEYNFLEKHLRKGKCPTDFLSMGGSCIDYARKANPNVFGMICEVPYIYDPRMFDETPLGISKRDIWLIGIMRMERMLSEIRKFYGRLEAGRDNPFRESIEYLLKFMEGRLKAEARWVKSSREMLKPATIADTIRHISGTIWYELLTYGALYRMAIYEFEAHGDVRARSMSRSALRKAKKVYKELMELANIRIIPIRRLVMVQLAAIMNIVRHFARPGAA